MCQTTDIYIKILLNVRLCRPSSHSSSLWLQFPWNFRFLALASSPSRKYLLGKYFDRTTCVLGQMVSFNWAQVEYGVPRAQWTGCRNQPIIYIMNFEDKTDAIYEKSYTLHGKKILFVICLFRAFSKKQSVE